MTEEWTTRIVLVVCLVGAGVLLIWIANAAASGRLKRNHFAGIRIPSTMASDDAWLAAHIRAKRVTIIGGAVSIVSGCLALLPVPIPALVITVLAGSLIMLALLLYGARIGGRAANEIANEPPR